MGVTVTSFENQRQVRETFPEVLSRVLKNVGVPTKVLARAAGRTPKAAERWLAGDNSMSAETFLALAREFDDVWELCKQQAGRSDTSAVEMLDQLEALLKARRSA